MYARPVLTCRVLGPTELRVGEARVELGGPLPRRLVTALVAAEGRPVDDDRLAETIWAGQVPPSAAASLQAYVSRLRRALGAARDAVVRTPAGYRLTVDGTDAETFADCVARGAYAEALALWRGEPFADLPATPEVEAARHRLVELREVAVEERSAARLAAGDAAGAAAELQEGVRAHPYRERRWELLIVALYRCGRQADALRALRRVRALLADELGVDPGPTLQRLERRLLAQDPRLLLPGPERTPGTAGRAAPPAANRSPAPAPAPALPQPLSSFVGRDTELADLRRLLAAHRLVTLVGPAGAGKTRLAVEHAAATADSGDGPWLVRLADVTDPAVLPSTVAAAAGVADPDPAALAAALTGRTGLLVLDNCEHLVAEVAGLVLALLPRCPRLRVLATSREPLGVDGERVLPVAPLPADTATDLLVDRVGAVRPGWRPDAAERDAARHLAQRLDGIPLAVELAAARAGVLGLRELAEHLDERFAVLGAVPRGSLAPHATLDAAIAWSVDLLSATDRALLLRLWPFEGGFPLEAADSVRPPGGGPSALESLSALVARSVVVADPTVTPTRYRLLETVRAYCRGRDEDPADSRACHAAWVRALIDRSTSELRGLRSPHANRVLGRELPNLRAAIRHDLAHDPAAALRAVGQLGWFWYRGGHVDEGERLLGAALAGAPDAPAVDRARAWAARGTLRYLAGDVPGAREAFAAAESALGDPVDVEGRTQLAQIAYYRAVQRTLVGDLAGAEAAARTTVSIGEELGEPWIVTTGRMALGGALAASGDLARGRAELRAAAESALAHGPIWSAATSDLLLARAELAGGDATAGSVLPILHRALHRFADEGDRSNVLAVLFTGARALAAAGRPVAAATLRAAVGRHAVRHGLRVETLDPQSTAALQAALEAALTPAERAAAEERGATLGWTEMSALLPAAIDGVPAGAGGTGA